MNEIVNFLVESVGALGYIGIFLLMFLESSFFPFPSEVVMVPAGYLASKGEMNLFLAILSGVLGSVAGAWFNYFLASRYGRSLVLEILKPHHLEKIEKFFENHGEISTFNGRLLPGIRQYISFPAGLAKMNPFKFTIFTALGAGIWVSILAMLGYFIGENSELIHKYIKEITVVTIIILIIVTIIYIKIKKSKK
ncbi:DedA family protein [Caminibacter mediatlanticus]|uniref:Integral membrane protein dedA-like protein n=1 Tax=Caminibacter mediatlanticus TB-2 TaxID=391592 RepID=A0AAI9F2E6_9BACT|nr:DedA family protein [Caminibacter mediatlanticus]EDM23733.1 putative integral membrane protein dedA-like protein [Caminibacter mediatlanticus TB-2]